MYVCIISMQLSGIGLSDNWAGESEMLLESDPRLQKQTVLHVNDASSGPAKHTISKYFSAR
jgi:hypothetical protein